LGRNLHSSRDSRVKAIATGRSRIHHEHKLNQGVQACSRAVQVAFFSGLLRFFSRKYPWPPSTKFRARTGHQPNSGSAERGRPFGRTAIIASSAPTQPFPFAPRGELEGKKNRFPFALCSPGNSVAVDGSRKDQVRRRRSTARSDLPPDRTALLGPRHAVVPGAVGQRLQITGLRQVRSLTRFGRIRAFWNFWGGSGCSVRVNFDGLAVKLAWLLLAFATSSRLSIRTTSPLILHHTKMNPIVRIILITSPDSRDNG